MISCTNSVEWIISLGSHLQLWFLPSYCFTLLTNIEEIAARTVPQYHSS